MSLHNSIKKASTGKIGAMGLEDIKRTFYPRHDILYTIQNYKFKLYTLDFYGMIYYNQSWDFWRKDTIRSSIHEKENFPFYVVDRSRLFDKKYSYKVDN